MSALEASGTGLALAPMRSSIEARAPAIGAPPSETTRRTIVAPLPRVTSMSVRSPACNVASCGALVAWPGLATVHQDQRRSVLELAAISEALARPGALAVRR